MKIFTLFVIIYSLFSFKINLIDYADTGIRLDDILIAVFGFITFLKKDLFLNKPIKIMTLYVAWSLFSTFINIFITGISPLQGVLFSIRNFEYLLFFYVGVYFRHYLMMPQHLFACYLIYSAVVVGAIYFGIISGVSDFHPSRAFANTNGPYEYVMLVSFIAIYFAHNGRLLLSSFAFFLMMLTSSRISIFAFFLIQFYNTTTNLKLFIIFSILLVFPLFVLFLEMSNFFLAERIFNLFSTETFMGIRYLVENIQLVQSQSDYINNVYNDETNTYIASIGGDTSALIRLNKWIILVLSTILLNPASLFIGMGPSFASVGVDGNFVRIFSETGLIGLILYLAFLWSLLSYANRNNEVILKKFILVLAISAVFIDLLVSYKVMLLLWFYFGYIYEKNRYKG